MKPSTARHMIIGTGVAGMAAVEAIRSVDGGAEIIMIGDEPAGYYSRPGLAYYLTGELNEAQLFPLSRDHFQANGARLIQGHVTRLDPGFKQIQLADGQVFSYDSLLIATGSAASSPSIQGSEVEGVVKLDCLEDARHILRLARKAKSAVVIGGGITALELVEGLVARNVKVHYFLRGDRYWGNVLDEIESRIVEGRLRHEGVTIHYQTEADEIHSERGRVMAVRTKDGKVIRCNLVALAVGIRPRKELAEAAGLKTERGILVDETLQTSEPKIYAAGDVAQVYDPVSGKYILDSLWGPARAQGSVAGANMAGARRVYRKPAAFNVTRLANLTTTIIGQVGAGRDDDLVGIARGDSETWRQLPDAIAAQADFEVNRLRVMVGRTTLLGAIVMGDQTLSRPLQRMITEQVDISSIRSQLLHPDRPLAEILVELWSAFRSGRHNAAQQP
jgi:NAD(P)H-nitrite reductase large subunit